MEKGRLRAPVSTIIILSIVTALILTPLAATTTLAADTTQETHRIEISSDGERTKYLFEVTGTISKVDTDNEERVSSSGGHAEGVVVDGTDVFEFTGQITVFSHDGNPTVVVDGNEIDESAIRGTFPQEYTQITISSNGDHVNYDFDVTGTIIKVDTDSEESVSGGHPAVAGSHAKGVVVDGKDIFKYSGELTDYEDDGDPTVAIGGDQRDTSDLGDDPKKHRNPQHRHRLRHPPLTPTESRSVAMASASTTTLM